jgi:hypothetical protein
MMFEWNESYLVVHVRMLKWWKLAFAEERVAEGEERGEISCEA